MSNYGTTTSTGWTGNCQCGGRRERASKTVTIRYSDRRAPHCQWHWHCQWATRLPPRAAPPPALIPLRVALCRGYCRR